MRVFCPFAPSVRREDMAGDWFDMDVDSPYMLMVGNVLDSKRGRRNQPRDEGGSLQGLDRLNVPRS